ncbi:MAG: hypothetical protein M3373_13970 [Gemmatimonadota bacterium]|nr:hypothetical protein [Gemmatimonadota bacterium]
MVGTDTTAFTLDAVGRAMNVWNSKSTDSLAFDVSGRLASAVTWRDGQMFELTSQYDPNDLRTRLDVRKPGNLIGHANWGYEVVFLQLQTLSGSTAGYSTSMSYNSDRQPTRASLPSCR